MGLEDRDWYRAEMARRKRRLLPGGFQRPRRVPTMAAVAIVAFLVSSIALTSSCDFDRWQATPAACWQRTWATLLQRIAGNPAYGACGYYSNSYGHLVPRPCGDWRTSIAGPPVGATALCVDGTYSYSEHPHSDWTCSYHGGVVQHLR